MMLETQDFCESTTLMTLLMNVVSGTFSYIGAIAIFTKVVSDSYCAQILPNDFYLAIQPLTDNFIGIITTTGHDSITFNLLLDNKISTFHPFCLDLVNIVYFKNSQDQINSFLMSCT